MKKVLVTNDDGIDAIGIRTLAEALAPMADVYVVAPSNQQSAKSHSITVLRTIKPEKREVKGAVAAYAVDGTPVDCVIWGLPMLAEEGIKPDFIFSGINHGMNTGLAAYYSGTVAAAREGALNGFHSIALSVGDHAVFDASEFEYIVTLIPMLMEMAEASGVGLDIDLKKIPIRQETIEICEVYDINPYLLISSGAMLIGTDHGSRLVEELTRAGIHASVIGYAVEGRDRIVRNGDEKRFLEPPKTDELYKVC